MLCADVMLLLLTRISLSHAQALCLALLLAGASKHRTVVMFPSSLELQQAGYQALGRWLRTGGGVLLTSS